MARNAALLAAALLVLAIARPAWSFPAFARKYGMSCTSCHLGWPIFNQEGQAFRDNGYQMGTGKDEPDTLTPGYWPIALRTTPAYQFTSQTNQPTDTGPTETRSGGVSIGGVDLLTGGTLAKDISFLTVISGFASDGTASVESAWVRLDNLAKSSWLNFKIGKFELDLPASAHRGVALTSEYAGYGAHPSGSMVGFDMGENQVGVELDGHNERSMTRYAIAVVSANEGPANRGFWSSPLVYGHVQQASDTGLAFLPWVRVGAFGALGYWPTSARSCTAPGCSGAPADAIPGTGGDLKRFERAGADLSFMLGYPSTPLYVTAAYIYGHEDAALYAPVTDSTGATVPGTDHHFHSGYVEADWVPISIVSYEATPIMIFARYDVVRYDSGPGDLDGVTAGIRHYLALGPRASAAIHIEGHWDRTRQVGWTDPNTGAASDVTTKSALVGLDFDF